MNLEKEEKLEEQNFIIELIEVYRSLPALWEVKSKKYSDKNKKAQQYEVLLKKYREKYAGADKKDLKQKINCLRTGYRKELKLSSLEKSGAGAIHEESQLYYFNAMNFLRGNEPSTSTSS